MLAIVNTSKALTQIGLSRIGVDREVLLKFCAYSLPSLTGRPIQKAESALRVHSWSIIDPIYRIEQAV